MGLYCSDAYEGTDTFFNKVSRIAETPTSTVSAVLIHISLSDLFSICIKYSFTRCLKSCETVFSLSQNSDSWNTIWLKVDISNGHDEAQCNCGAGVDRGVGVREEVLFLFLLL